MCLQTIWLFYLLTGVCIKYCLLYPQAQTVRPTSMNVPPTPASTRGRALTMSLGTSATVSCPTRVWKYYWKYLIHPCVGLVFRHFLPFPQPVCFQLLGKEEKCAWGQITVEESSASRLPQGWMTPNLWLLLLLCYTSIPIRELENIFMPSHLFCDKTDNDGKAKVTFSCICRVVYFGKIHRTLNNKGPFACAGVGTGVLDTFPVCLLPVSQNSKWFHNGRKLDPASCRSRVLWKQIGKCLRRPLTLTEPG